MRSPLKIAPGGPAPRSPEREALAAAITRFDSTTAAAASVPPALQTARVKVSAADDRVQRARQEIADAKAAAAAHITASALGAASDAAPSVREARSNLADAEDALEAATASRDMLLASQAAADQQARYARYPLEKAIAAVVTAEATAVLFDMIRAHCAARSQLATAHRDIDFLLNAMGLRVNDLPATLRGWNTTFWTDESGVPSSWARWAKALESDADAPLPDNKM